MYGFKPPRIGGFGRGAIAATRALRRWSVPLTSALAGWRRVRWEHAVLAVLIFATLILAPAAYLYKRYESVVLRTLRNGFYNNAFNIYAAPRTIDPGEKLTPEFVAKSLQRAGYSTSPDNPVGHYVASANEVAVYPGPQSYFQADPAVIRFRKGAVSSLIVPGTKKKLEQYSLEPELISNLADGEREMRRLVRFSDMPPVLVQAVVSVEDKRFFEHAGFDPLRILKATYVDLKEHRKQQGASTITMQLARSLYLHPEKRWRRKISELMISAILEQRLSKPQIFELYANQVYLGRYETYNIHGFGEAADVYFGKSIRKLNLPEAALIAGMIQRPSYFNPYRSPERAIARRNLVLRLMRDNGYIASEQLRAAEQAPLGLAPPRTDSRYAPYFLALMNQELKRRWKDDAEETGSLKIYTTLDPDLQRAAVEAVRAAMPKVDARVRRKHIARDGAHPQVALVALNPRTGEIKALVGGRDYSKSQLNHAIAMRQPGSTFKPFVFAAAFNTALEGGSRVFTEATTVLDQPTTFLFATGPYQPANFGNNYKGLVTLREAMALSLNSATVSLAEQVGYDKVVAMARRAGISSRLDPTPAVALGAYETTPLELAGAYTVFANQGEYTQPTFLDKVIGPDGEVILHGSPRRYRALDPRVSYVMLDLLSDVVREGTAAGIRARGFTGEAAGKTGTSRDGWFAGFTPDLLCVVWVGFDDNRDLGIEGADSALPIWTEFMRRAAKLDPSDRTFPPPPDGVVPVDIDPSSGQLAGPYCPASEPVYFISGTEPALLCEAHRKPFLDVSPAGLGIITGVSSSVPPEYAGPAQ